MIKNCFFIIILLHICGAGFINGYAQTASDNEIYLGLKEKNFYLLFALDKQEPIRAQIATLPSLKLSDQQVQAVTEAMTKAQNDHLCDAFIIDQKTSNTFGNTLGNFISAHHKDFIDDLRASGAYAQLTTLNDADFIAQAWDLCHRGLTGIINTYGKGQKPLYPTIDSISYDAQSDFLKYSVASWAGLARDNAELRKNGVAYDMTLEFALSLLYMNHRDEAVRYEPLIKFNGAAAEYAQQLDFSKYDYASIIVLGNGPENTMDRLSSMGKYNLRKGVDEYFNGRAPFIIVSGGHAHPFRAPFAEAIEMKKELMNVYGIAEKHIIIEPYARHTTTNLRNATRLMLDYNIPLAQPSLVVTNTDHSHYTFSPKYLSRCQEELGYDVGRFGQRLSPTTIEFYPSPTCTQQNPIDPLDP